MSSLSSTFLHAFEDREPCGFHDPSPAPWSRFSALKSIQHPHANTVANMDTIVTCKTVSESREYFPARRGTPHYTLYKILYEWKMKMISGESQVYKATLPKFAACERVNKSLPSEVKLNRQHCQKKNLVTCPTCHISAIRLHKKKTTTKKQKGKAQ